jgi:GT2 family glycosyltransferase
MIQLNASIVLYHNDKEQLLRTIDSFLSTSMSVKLYLVDNSSNNVLKELEKIDNRIEYIFNNENLGFGAAHNIAIRKSLKDNVFYHLVLNPDIYFDDTVLVDLYRYMETNKEVGNIIPQVSYPDGSRQYLSKLLPTPVDLILRRFVPFEKWKEQRNNQYELRFSGYNSIMNVPSLSGCFMFLRTSVLDEIGLFDENFFMYLEDIDLNRRIHRRYKTLFYPSKNIVHEYAKKSYVSKKLLLYHIKSAIYYFNKWGWFLDRERDNLNDQCLRRIGFGRKA